MTNEQQLAYVAGFFDGEGSISLRVRSGKYPFLQLSMTQTSRPVLEFVQGVLGVGIIHGPYAPSNGLSRKHKYVYRVCQRAQVVEVMRALWPYCIVKRPTILAALEHVGAPLLADTAASC